MEQGEELLRQSSKEDFMRVVERESLGEKMDMERMWSRFKEVIIDE